MFYFNCFTSSINIIQFVPETDSLPCKHAGSPFTNKDHGHILTVGLRIIKSNKFRKLILMGPKYRKSKAFDIAEKENE